MKGIRLKLTESCHYSCFYCSGRKEGQPMALPEEKILGLCQKKAEQGISCFALEGGEPLLCPETPELVRRLCRLPGVKQVTLTTSGTGLKDCLEELKQAGLGGINLHMDVCDASAYQRITGKAQVLNPILEGIWTAVAKEIPLVITSVLNPESKPYLAVMAGFSRKYPITLRFVSLDQGIQGAEAQQREALDILSRTIHGMEADAQGIWHVPGWKGQICFGKEIGGAFGMDQAPVIPVWER